jgi:hypothetical protein
MLAGSSCRVASRGSGNRNMLQHTPDRLGVCHSVVCRLVIVQEQVLPSQHVALNARQHPGHWHAPSKALCAA